MASIGIIYPPPELRTVVDTAAQYVAKNGEDFEKKILKNEGSKTKFGFIMNENPYHSYYKMRIEDFKKNPNLEVSKPKKQVTQNISKKTTAIQRNRPKKDPLVYHYGLQVPEGMKPFELDLIKLTSQYVARNGRPFLSALAGRESRNSQFDFLKVQHRYFSFFTKLTEIYKRILIPPKSTIEDLIKYSNNKLQLLQLIYSKGEWEIFLNELRIEKNNQVEIKNEIDWSDFILVEKIDFTLEDFMSNMTNYQKEEEEEEKMEEISSIDNILYNNSNINPIDSLIQNTFNEINNESEEEEEEEEDNEKQNESEEDMDIEEDEEENIKIKKNYIKKKPIQKKKEEIFKDPKTGELIPMNQLNEHLRVQLINPKWSEQKERENEKFKTTNIAKDDELKRYIYIIKQR
eukprot:gene7770-12240_t